jgi:UDP-N-acetylglucosamine--N-acetylmuramyl-(pentapeptide) pyrophosphoryl-undecaprenol N-acetylglucosamine transferase
MKWIPGSAGGRPPGENRYKGTVEMEKKLKRVIFTCGGTAGHVNPALALAGLMKEKNPEMEFLFVGAERGLEKDLIPKAGYPFRTVHISSFHRSFQPKEIKHNLISVGNLFRAPGEARAILREFRPDVVIGTGGYASFPLVKAAAKAGIPTAVHESNMVPGLTTGMLEPFADRILVGFEACRKHYKHPEKVIVTGTPVRGDFFQLTKAEARRQLGIDGDRPLVVSFWGSLGASGMNRRMADFMALEAAKEPFWHIHGAGKGGYPVMQELLAEKGVDLAAHPALQLREYIYDMAPVMRAADLVVCRAGASTISELTALGVPALIVPSPYVTNNHQEKNARVLEEAGGAAVLLEQDATGQALFQTVCGILHQDARRASMEKAMATLGIRDATERIYQTVLEITQ